MKFPNILNGAKVVTSGIKKVGQAIIALPIGLKVISALILVSFVGTIVTQAWEFLTAKNTPEKIYEEFEIEDVSELIEIKEYDGGYYLDFAEGVDEKLDDLVETLQTSGRYHNVPKELLKKMIKAEVVTEFPNLGGEIPQNSSGFQGVIDIKRISPNKEVGELKNTGQGETSNIEQETEEVNDATEQEEEIKTWNKGKELEIYSNSIVYEQVDSDTSIGNAEKNETGVWQEKIVEGTLNQKVTIKKDANIKYNGQYRVSTSPLTGSTTIYVEVTATQGDEEITGYIKAGKIVFEKETQDENETKEEAKITTVSSRAETGVREEKEIVGDNESQEYTVAIAAGHSTVNPGASANGLVEQELTIQVAEKVQELIESQYENIRVVQTGSTSSNKDIDNKDRISLAKAEDPDLCIQIHFNASGENATEKGTGVEAIYKPGDEISGQLAEILSKTISEEMGLENRGAGIDTEKSSKSLGIIANYVDTGFPSVVTEGGFLDNTNDANIIKNGGVEKYAQGIVNGIKEYLEADHTGYTSSKQGDEKVTESVESRIYNLKYIPLDELKAMEGDGKSSDDVKEATKYFSLDENNKLITLTWNMGEDGNITIKENSPMDLKTELQKYTMPFEYLLMFYIDTDFRDFVDDLANVVLDSEIVVAIQDQVTTTETTVNTYEKKQATSSLGSSNNYEDRLIEEERKYTLSEICSTSTDITYVDVWCVKTYQTNSYSEAVLNMGDNDEIIAKVPGKVTESSSSSVTEYSEYQTGLTGQVSVWNNELGTFEPKEYTYNLYRKTKTDVHSIRNSYDKGDTKVEKQEDKFVDLYVEYSMNNRLREQWLFKIMENNERTANLLDLTKYLMFKATNINYGVISYDFSEFDLNAFNGTTGIYGDTAQEKVWFAVLDAGYSKYAAAGVLGNIQAESGFNENVIEGGSGIGFGLCQWSFGRRTQLEAYAASKGKEPSDLNTQIEFLIGEITPGGGADGYANYNLLSYNGYSPSDWENASSPEDAAVAFCWTFERPGVPRMDVRTEAARKYYEEFKDKEKPAGGSVTSIQAVLPNYSFSTSSGFGYRNGPFLGNEFHQGTDIPAPTGTEIAALGGGVIKEMVNNSSRGLYVRIDHENGLETVYQHCSAFASGLNVGDRVSQGQIIAYVGSTGDSTGAHLHLEILVPRGSGEHSSYFSGYDVVNPETFDYTRFPG